MLLVVLIAWQTWPDVSLLLRDVILGIFLIIIFVYDLKYGYILDRFTVPGMILAVVFNFALGIVSVESMALGAFVVGGFLLCSISSLKENGLGRGHSAWGDDGIDFGVVARSAGVVYWVCAWGRCRGGASGKRTNVESAVPFGTFLTVGTVAAMLWGEK